LGKSQSSKRGCSAALDFSLTATGHAASTGKIGSCAWIPEKHEKLLKKKHVRVFDIAGKTMLAHHRAGRMQDSESTQSMGEGRHGICIDASTKMKEAE
jgi:hypothetical protein